MNASQKKLAIQGGQPVVDRSRWPTWPPRLSGLSDAVNQVIQEDQWGVRSSTIEAFEEAFARTHDAEYGLAMANGTMALLAALKATGIGPGDEVIIPAYTFVATATAVLQAGARPVFTDIDPHTFNLDPEGVRTRITPATKAIMPVHIGGNPADLAAFMKLANQHDLVIIEDAAQAPGAIYNERKVGAQGNAGGFSFQSSKNITSGEGGILLTNDRQIYEQAFEVYNCGRTITGPWYEHVSPGLNLRLSAFQAAVLLYQMDHLEEWAATREANGRYLEEQLDSIPGITCARRYPATTRNAYHLLIFTYDGDAFDGLPKARFLEALSAEGVVATEGYRPLYEMPFLRPYLHEGTDQDAGLPVTEHACMNGVWIRQFELLAERSMMDGIVEAIRKVQKHAASLLEAST